MRLQPQLDKDWTRMRDGAIGKMRSVKAATICALWPTHEKCRGNMGDLQGD